MPYSDLALAIVGQGLLGQRNGARATIALIFYGKSPMGSRIVPGGNCRDQPARANYRGRMEEFEWWCRVTGRAEIALLLLLQSGVMTRFARDRSNSEFIGGQNWANRRGLRSAPIRIGQFRRLEILAPRSVQTGLPPDWAHSWSPLVWDTMPAAARKAPRTAGF